MISFLKRQLHKFSFAFHGLFHGIRKDRSIQIQVFIGCLVLLLCTCLSFNVMEWIIIMLLVGLVISVEFINSAIERIVDIVSPQYSEAAKLIKDYAAAAVLVISIIAACIGVLIIASKLI